MSYRDVSFDAAPPFTENLGSLVSNIPVLAGEGQTHWCTPGGEGAVDRHEGEEPLHDSKFHLPSLDKGAGFVLGAEYGEVPHFYQCMANSF